MKIKKEEVISVLKSVYDQLDDNDYRDSLDDIICISHARKSIEEAISFISGVYESKQLREVMPPKRIERMEYTRLRYIIGDIFKFKERHKGSNKLPVLGLIMYDIERDLKNIIDKMKLKEEMFK